MAVSKNNRKNGKKRTKGHRAPVTDEQRKRAVQVNTEAQEREKKRFRLSLIAIAVMAVGLFIAWQGYRIFGYPITFVGGLAGLYAARHQDKGRKVTIVCYTIYCLLVAYMWIVELMAA
ncbi:MAG TPA: hypothetical protein IAA32_01845 [Candidatus Butyricicoccus stercorigallinarum]|nr:hypothetical protein [Candidatus Butyricicoccus stercorigallinarum]